MAPCDPMAPLQASCIYFVLASSSSAGRMYMTFTSSTLVKAGLTEMHVDGLYCLNDHLYYLPNKYTSSDQ